LVTGKKQSTEGRERSDSPGGEWWGVGNTKMKVALEPTACIWRRRIQVNSLQK